MSEITEDILSECRTFFKETGRHFANYFLRYAVDHRNDGSRIEAEYANLLTAARYCRDTDNYSDLLVLREVLQPHLDLHGHWNASLMLNEWAIAAAQMCGDRISVVRFTHDRADILHQCGEYRQAEQLYRSSEEAYLVLGENGMALRSRHMCALVVRAQGRLGEAAQLCDTTIADAQRLGLNHWLPHPLYVRALLARDCGDIRRARQCIEESLSHLAGSDELVMIGQCRHFLGELALRQGRFDEARSQLKKSLELSQQVGILRRVVATQRLLGDLARDEGQYDEADNLYHGAFGTAIRLGDQPQMARLLLSQARLAVIQERRQEAIDMLRSARITYQRIGDPRGVVMTSLLLARWYLKQGQFGRAVLVGATALKTVRLTSLLQPRTLLGAIRQRGDW